MEDNQFITSEELSDKVVISGFSGRLPESSTIQEFEDNLFNGIDMVNDEPRRWPNGLYNLPSRHGKIKDDDLERCDIEFFGIHSKQGECMDPQMRLLLELTHEAIIDAGINPRELRGSRTGVYVGMSSSDMREYYLADPDRVLGYDILGTHLSMFANRLSFAFDFKGPSCTMDTMCSSSLYAMSRAFEDLNAGYCSAAIVAGSNLILDPLRSLQYKKIGVLSDDGKCKTFDETGDGYVRSDGCVIIFMQKSSQARRIYSTVLNVRTNTDGSKEEGFISPNREMQMRLLRETYKEIGLNPSDVAYVEVDGTGSKEGDQTEVNAITDFFGNERRDNPLLVGSVKSNMGHAEAASGLCSIAKVLLAMEACCIPGNLHYATPNPDMHAIIDGRIKVVDRNTSWTGGIVGVSSFGFGGSNAHVILKSNSKQKLMEFNDRIPRLVLLSGRTDGAIDLLLNAINENKDDVEFLSLINGIHATNTPLHRYRGYAVIDSTIANVLGESDRVTDDDRPIWFIYTGMGSQWASMAKGLMRLDVFQKSMERCADVLKPKGIDLIALLTESDETVIDNVLNAVVSIVAVQIGLTDVLTHLGIKPTGIIGHSFGEISCAYADSCFTAEETLLIAYCHGNYADTTPFEKGMMASVGLSKDEIKDRLPNDVFLACNNGADNVTIAGRPESVLKFVEQLKSEEIFAKPVKSSGFAFHTKYVSDMGPLRNELGKIILEPKIRSSRWVSSSVPESNWSTPLGETCSAAYFAHNIESPVLFHEAVQKAPKNAICIEIAPTGLLQAVLKRSLGADAINLSLMKRGHENNLAHFLTNIGKLYVAGAKPDVLKLYQPISYPVGRGTPMLNSSIGWNHAQQFHVPKLGMDKSSSNGNTIDVSLTADEYSYLAGHTIDGRILFPVSAYLTMVWRIFAKAKHCACDEMPVVMEDLVFHRTTTLSKDGATLKFSVKISNTTGYFEIMEDGSLVVSGKIFVPENIEFEELPLDPHEHDSSAILLRTEDVYKELCLRGYDYAGEFRGIVESDLSALTGKLQCSSNWTTFMDSMIQFSILGERHWRELHLPTRIERAVINPLEHKEQGQDANIPIYVYKDINVIKAGGIEFRGLKISQISPRRSDTQSTPILERNAFVPLQNVEADLLKSPAFARVHAVSVATQLVIENCGGAMKIKVADMLEDKAMDTSLVQIVQNTIANYHPPLDSDITIITNQTIEAEYAQVLDTSGIHVVSMDSTVDSIELNNHLIVAYDVVNRHNADVILQNLMASICVNGFILLEESTVGYDEAKAINLFASLNLTIVSIQRSFDKQIILIRPIVDIAARNKSIVSITNQNYDWSEELKSALAVAESEQRYVYIAGENEKLLGAVGLINCIKHEIGGKFARFIFVQDENVEKFAFISEMYANQLNKDLVINVYRNGVWGTFQYFKLDASEIGQEVLVEHAYVSALNKGDSFSLSWIEGPCLISNSNMERCTVYYVPVNSRDVMMSTGKLASQERVLGSEFSGRDSSGRRIMALVHSGSMATTCLVRRNLMWEVPSNWTMEQASTIPCVYSTVYYALVVRGKMKRGESILVHAGGGGIGLAAICVALHYGLVVYATVASKEQRRFLKKIFPQLTNAHIGDSRDTSFEQFIMRATNGHGVDLVLNSLPGEKLLASVRCLGLNGRFLQIGEIDLNDNSTLGMSVFLKNTSFHGIRLDSVLGGDEKTIEMIVNLVANGIRNGAIRPLPTTIFDSHEIGEALRFVICGKHVGKAVVKIREEEQQKVIKPTPKQIAATPKTHMHGEKSYIIIGDLDDFALELANWLVSRGATKLVLASRIGVQTGYQSLMIRRWTERGVSVSIDTNDVTTLEGSRNLIVAANKLAPIGGIFNLATVRCNNVFINQTENNCKSISSPKIDVAKHLDAVTRTLCPDLDHFICFSSVSCGRGNAGQINYGWANSSMECICEQHQTDGLSATCIQWSVIGGDDEVIVDLDLNLNVDDKETIATLQQRIHSCLQTLDIFMEQKSHPVLASRTLAGNCNSECIRKAAIN